MKALQRALSIIEVLFGITIVASTITAQTSGHRNDITPQATCTGQYRAREPNDILETNDNTVIDDTRYFDFFDHTYDNPLLLFRHRPTAGANKYWHAP